MIKTNFARLIELLDTDGDLIAAMTSACCLSHRQLSYLKDLTETHKRSGKLLEMLKRRGIGHFNLFLGCLQQTQRHLIPLLSEHVGKH